MHYVLEAVPSHPIYHGPVVEDCDTKHLRVLRAFEQLCTAPVPLRTKTLGLR